MFLMQMMPQKSKNLRRQQRKKQQRINANLKKTLYKNVYMASCCYCNFVFLVEQLTIEHITPLSMGGTNAETNISLACAPCNHAKGRETWFLKKKPYHKG